MKKINKKILNEVAEEIGRILNKKRRKKCLKYRNL